MICVVFTLFGDNREMTGCRGCNRVLDSWSLLNQRSLSGSFMAEFKRDHRAAAKEIYSNLLQTLQVS